ncbi:MAG: universal stress protein, partial [Candidatus Hydrogenedentes bacterium]|nr:universal stress protein [Candidatus Hydrogenedentota bacterium]
MFHLRNVLFATDFSHYALYALNYAVAIARQEGGVVHVAHVLDANLYSSGSGLGVWLTNKDMEKLLDSMQEHAESRLTHLVSTIQASGVAEAQHHILRGNAAAEICQHARQLDVDVIVLATHGRTGFDHVVFGSVAEKVVRQSQLPVLCVKHPEHEFIQGADQ